MNGCVAGDATELEAYALPLPAGRRGECLSVPANSGGIVSSTTARGVLLGGS